MDKVSVIIPSRNSPFICQTIDDIFKKAKGEIEVIVTLDGYEPDPPLAPRKGLEIIENEVARGMRHGINSMAGMATGRYLLKCDDHCAFGEGFDVILAEHIDADWLVTPTRYRLDAKTWDRYADPIEYLYLTFPYIPDSMYGPGFHGRKWIGIDGIGKDMGKKQYYWMENARRHVKIDDIQTIQGSGWFMTKEHFERINGLDEVHNAFYQEANELCFKTWMIGGACKVNKNTWYAHYHKNEPSRFGLTMTMKRESQRFQTWVWMNDKWPKAVRKMSWFANSLFYPIPSWPATWHTFVREDNNFRVFDLAGHDGFGVSCIQ